MPMGDDPPGAYEASYVEGFNNYFGPGPELEARLQDVVDGIDPSGADKGHDDKFWSVAENQAPKAHFDDDWVGGKFWPGQAGEALYSKLRSAVREAAVLAGNGGKAKPLAIALTRAAGSSVDVAVADGADSVTITIATPAPTKQ